MSKHRRAQVSVDLQDGYDQTKKKITTNVNMRGRASRAAKTKNTRVRDGYQGVWVKGVGKV
jgi:hypothetical protein